MSREDKARHTLHQTLIIDGFCRAGLALGFPPPSPCLRLSVCSPPPTRHPFESGSESGTTFLIALGFLFLGRLYFLLILLYR